MRYRYMATTSDRRSSRPVHVRRKVTGRLALHYMRTRHNTLPVPLTLYEQVFDPEEAKPHLRLESR